MERGWRRAAARRVPRRTLCLGQVPCAMSCTCFRVACSICSLLLPMRCAALAPGRNATKERGWSSACMRGCNLVVQRGLAHVCAGVAWLCSVHNAGQTSKIGSSKNNQASACMRRAEHWRRWKQPGLGKASTDVCSAGQVQFARAGSRALNRKTLAGRDRDLDAVRRVVVFSVVAA